MNKVAGAALVAVVYLGSACGAGQTQPSANGAPGAEPSALAEHLAASCERSRPGAGPRPQGGGRQGSSVALARRDGALVAYVADRDRSRLVVVDVGARKMLADVPVLGAPEQVLILGDGRVV